MFGLFFSGLYRHFGVRRVGVLAAKKPNRIPHKFAFLQARAKKQILRNDEAGELQQKFSIWIPFFAGMTALGFLMSACTQQEVVDSTGASAKGWCKSARNCTLNNDNPAAR